MATKKNTVAVAVTEVANTRTLPETRNGQTWPTHVTPAQYGRITGRDEKQVRQRLRSFGAREIPELFDKSIGMWKSIQVGSESFWQLHEISQGKRAMSIANGII